jgi:hypothetical protein
MEMFAATAEIKLLHVAYQGGDASVVGLLRGKVDALSIGPFDGHPARQYLEALEPNAFSSAISRTASQLGDQRISEDLHSFGVLALRAKLPGHRLLVRTSTQSEMFIMSQ